MPPLCPAIWLEAKTLVLPYVFKLNATLTRCLDKTYHSVDSGKIQPTLYKGFGGISDWQLARTPIAMAMK